MSNPVMPATTLVTEQGQPLLYTDPRLAQKITKAASHQTYYTIRWLVDRGRVPNAYRAYAYFRWVDDCLDAERLTEHERRLFAERQQRLIDSCYRGEAVADLAAEEQLLVDLVHTDTMPHSGLRAYIENMLRVMLFDATRRGRLISQAELTEYTRWLATAVTEAMHYFIGHTSSTPHDATRYCAVMAAHITHMLRDTCEDVAAGYFNIAREFLETHHIAPTDFNSEAHREWVKARIQLARECFATGRVYLAQLKSLRCRIAGYAYMSRFEGILDSIERDHYQLRPAYPENKGFKAGLRMVWCTITRALKLT